MRNGPFRARTSQPTPGLAPTCPQTEENDHSASLGVICGQHDELPAVFRFKDWSCRYKSVTYPNSSRFWGDTDPIHWPKIPPPRGIEPAPHLRIRVQSSMP